LFFELISCLPLTADLPTCIHAPRDLSPMPSNNLPLGSSPFENQRFAVTRPLSNLIPVLVVAFILSGHTRAAENYPAADPPLPRLVEPGQTEEPSVYRARRAALMEQMKEGVAVVYAEGEEDGDGYRQSSDFLYLTGVQERGAILVLAPKERTVSFSCCPIATPRPNVGLVNASRLATHCARNTVSKKSAARAA
jgi:hypothetical protein